MAKKCPNRAYRNKERELRPATTSIAAAVLFALHGAARAAPADQTQAGPSSLQEVVVTATRREGARRGMGQLFWACFSM